MASGCNGAVCGSKTALARWPFRHETLFFGYLVTTTMSSVAICKQSVFLSKVDYVKDVQHLLADAFRCSMNKKAKLPPTLYDKIVDRLRNNRAVVFVLLLTVLTGGAATFLSGASALCRAVDLCSGVEAPRIVQFGLDLGRSSYHETIDFKFGAGPSIRTFSPDPSFFGEIRTFRAVFKVVIENPNDRDMLLTEIEYDISEIGQVAGGSPGPLESKATYFHRIEYKIGKQKVALDRPFRIPTKSAELLHLELYTTERRPGLTWIMRVRFVTNQGNAETDKFQIVLAGKEID